MMKIATIVAACVMMSTTPIYASQVTSEHNGLGCYAFTLDDMPGYFAVPLTAVAAQISQDDWNKAGGGIPELGQVGAFHDAYVHRMPVNVEQVPGKFAQCAKRFGGSLPWVFNVDD